jgi:transposase
MIGLSASTRVVLATEPVDLRRGHDGLITLVRSLWQDDPYSGTLFVVLGRRRDRIKVLFFSTGGFVVYYKRLERGRFTLPTIPEGATQVTLAPATLAMLLEGLDVRTVRGLRAWSPPSQKSA